jgi:hypothetical protein
MYSQEVRNVVKAVHESRFRKWPSRPNSQVLFKLLKMPEASTDQRVDELIQRAYSCATASTTHRSEDVDRDQGHAAEQWLQDWCIRHASSDKAQQLVEQFKNHAACDELKYYQYCIEARELLCNMDAHSAGGLLFPSIKVVVVALDRECGMIEGMDLTNLEEAHVKDAISRLTGIHPNRIMCLMPDGETVLHGDGHHRPETILGDQRSAVAGSRDQFCCTE